MNWSSLQKGVTYRQKKLYRISHKWAFKRCYWIADLLNLESWHEQVLIEKKNFYIKLERLYSASFSSLIEQTLSFYIKS